jgi:hypothetical protein
MRIRYDVITWRRDGYTHYSDVLREEFGGKSVEVTDEGADFCAQQGWCVRGGFAMLFPNEDSKALKKFEESLNKRGLNFWSQPGSGMAWRWLVRYAKRQAAKRKALRKAA